MTTGRSGLEGKRVLVTGGAGFIGSHIVDALVGSGSNAFVVDNLSSGSRAVVTSQAHFFEQDVADQSLVGRIVEIDPDVVIHAAAQVSVPASVADPDRDRRINLRGTENVLNGAKEASVERLVFISSGGAIYGDSGDASESDVPRPASPYGIHKLAAEGYVRTSGLSYAIARFANVYGPRQRSYMEGGVVSIFIDHLTSGAPVTVYGSGEQARDFVYVSDVVDATLLMGRSQAAGTWNVSTGRPTSVWQLLGHLENLVAPASSIHNGPERAGDVAISFLSPAKIGRELGWTSKVPLIDGLRATVERYSQS